MGAAELLERIAASLQYIADMASQGSQALYTANDFPLAKVSGSTLDALLASEDGIQDIYPLSPMQEAMLVHSLPASESGVTLELNCMQIRATQIGSDKL